MAKASELFSLNKRVRKGVSVTNAEGPPVPIPNTEVKLCSGENTSREAVREDSPMLTLERGQITSALNSKKKAKWLSTTQTT